MSYRYSPLGIAKVDLHYLTREKARRCVIKEIREAHSNGNIDCIRFITGRGNHINATGERGVLYDAFPSWVRDTKVKHLIRNYYPHNGYYEVYLDLENAHSISKYDFGCFRNFINWRLIFLFSLILSILLCSILYIIVIIIGPKNIYIRIRFTDASPS